MIVSCAAYLTNHVPGGLKNVYFATRDKACFNFTAGTFGMNIQGLLIKNDSMFNDVLGKNFL